LFAITDQHSSIEIGIAMKSSRFSQSERPTRRIFAGLVVVLSAIQPGLALAQLQPSEVAVIAARSNRESQALANYYCRQRGIPVENICLIDVPGDELLTRETWTWAVRPELQKWLVENDPDQQLRCLVTVWGVPLRIGKADPTPESKRYETYLNEEIQHRLLMLKQATVAINAIADGENPNDVGPAAKQAGQVANETLADVQAQLEAALQAAQQAIATKPESERQLAGQQLQRMATIVGGVRVLLNSMDSTLKNPQSEAPAGLKEQFALLQGRTGAFGDLRFLLDRMAPNPERDTVLLTTVEQTAGLIGTVDWLTKQLQIARKNETASSFDSELSLVTWPDEYQLLRWQPNYLHANYDNSQLKKYRRTFMVSRLDGPTIEIAKRLVDDAIAVEKSGGLRGKVYVDARGIAEAEEQPTSELGSYKDYDQALLNTAKLFGEQTDYEVVLNDNPQLFQPGECPETALYFGWYSLGKYVDAFEFNRGAIGIHYASGEARTLRESGSEVWCKRMLEEGVCATIGPVYEPYLISFPRPDQLSSLLLGDLTLVECYYRTKPFNSWMMILVGDPLYRPFAK
jgi:uncharacterized protein (TIGR03790 family)